MLSIDQNCHPLWDALPKIDAVRRLGRITHAFEDIDVAFTEIGAGAGESGLRLARERYYRGGQSDWGAALFYSEFLGRLPIDLAPMAQAAGVSARTLARHLNTSIDDLYGRHSVSDNWQLIGPSFAGDRDHHRTIGDLTVVEIEPFLREMFDKAHADMRRAFIETPARRRIDEWFESERRRMERLIERTRGGRLIDLYREWMAGYFGDSVELSLTSDVFACRKGNPALSLADTFIRHYGQAAALYNRAVRETALGLSPLDTGTGELPFFAAFERQGHRVRAGVRFVDGRLVVADREFALDASGGCPAEAMRRAGIVSLAGKAVVLVVQCRMGPAGRALVLPYRGSLYTPAAERFVGLMTAAGLIEGPLKPIRRVRFRLLDRMAETATRIRLPAHLAEAFGTDEIGSAELSARYRQVAGDACARLDALRDPNQHRHEVARLFPKLSSEIAALRHHQQQRHEDGVPFEETNRLWRETKAKRRELIERLLGRIARDAQVAEIDYWDSRGAILPWCVALGGEAFYKSVIERAEIFDE